MVEISDETAEVAFRELEMLIDSTLTDDDDGDPLQDDIFRACDELEHALIADPDPDPDPESNSASAQSTHE